ncbi:MAG TPA: DNA-directed RNA polymerase subunit RpoH/Rpb5 C-terminal domain-containing protein, partial [Saprospiraceae bacterium]|nr:DNA-directed RNA polymerase subunit RpoH/Rpb5 C-terminal domain-containing protein [Saprospiraceae bacterium]
CPRFSLFRSFCTVIEMLTDRGYIIPEEYNYKIDEHYQDFIEWMGGEDFDIEEAHKNLQLCFEKANGAKILTFWFLALGKNDVQTISETLIEENVKNAIVVHINKITACAGPAIKDLRVLKYFIEPFLQTELQFNIMKHQYVPKHIICSAKKKTDVLEQYSITKDQLPRILSSDPICRYLGAVKGQLIKIIRPSDSIPEIKIKGANKELFDVSYRIVV